MIEICNPAKEERRKRKERSENRISENWTKYILEKVEQNIAYFSMEHYDYKKYGDTETKKLGKGEAHYNIMDKYYTKVVRKMESSTVDSLGNEVVVGNSMMSIIIQKIK